MLLSTRSTRLFLTAPEQIIGIASSTSRPHDPSRYTGLRLWVSPCRCSLIMCGSGAIATTNVSSAPTVPTASIPVREVAEAGIPFGLHCDAPVTPLNPLFTMWCAVNRVTSGGRPLGVDQAVDTATAMRGYTTDAAWLSFDEASLGGLSPGHLADFVVLDRNPFTTDPALLRDIEVLRTVVGGETVFET